MRAGFVSFLLWSASAGIRVGVGIESAQGRAVEGRHEVERVEDVGNERTRLLIQQQSPGDVWLDEVDFEVPGLPGKDR